MRQSFGQHIHKKYLLLQRKFTYPGMGNPLPGMPFAGIEIGKIFELEKVQIRGTVI